MNNDKYYGLQEDYEPDDEMTPEGVLNPTDEEEELFNANEFEDPRDEDDQAPLGDEPDFEGPDDDQNYAVGRFSRLFDALNEEGDDEEEEEYDPNKDKLSPMSVLGGLFGERKR